MTDKPSHLRPVPTGATTGALAHAEPPPEWNGITPTPGRAHTSRFLSDVIIELGFATRETVQPAIENARQQGTKVAVVNPYFEPGLQSYWVPSVPESALFGTKLADRWFPVDRLRSRPASRSAEMLCSSITSSCGSHSSEKTSRE